MFTELPAGHIMDLMRASTRVTIKDIAQRAGVSKTTVSFAFNEPAKLSSSTCTRVLAMAMELGSSCAGKGLSMLLVPPRKLL